MFLLYFIYICILFMALLVVSAYNPIHSLFFLILVFLFSSLIFFFLQLEFFALIFLIIYIGAILVLFLFVIMMLNLK
jgi:NADH-quinone oxidoreductase subunit J